MAEEDKKPPSVDEQEVEEEEEEEREEAAAGSSHGEKTAPAAVELTPWEQHSSVIILPRFDYAAPSFLLQRPHSGFLVTCPIKREKSATKEAILLLKQCMQYGKIETLESCEVVSMSKRRKIALGTDVKSFESADNGFRTCDKKATDVSPTPLSSERDEDAEHSLNLSLIKLTRSGLLLFTFPCDKYGSVVRTFSKLSHSLQNGELKSPLWCNRIFPIQQTCVLKQNDVQRVVSKLVEEYLGNEQEKLDKPFKFAVGYNRRGIDETEMKSRKSTRKDSEESSIFDRDTCFKVVAGAVKAVAVNSVVDLMCPEVAVLVEVLPISGLPHGTLVVGVSVLPLEFVNTKPRLCVKPLVAEIKKRI